MVGRTHGKEADAPPHSFRASRGRARSGLHGTPSAARVRDNHPSRWEAGADMDGVLFPVLCTFVYHS